MFGDQSIGFIGGGNMGEALIRGLIAASLFSAERIFAYDVIPSRIEYLEKEFGIKGRLSLGELAECQRHHRAGRKTAGYLRGARYAGSSPLAQAARHIHRGWNFAFYCSRDACPKGPRWSGSCLTLRPSYRKGFPLFRVGRRFLLRRWS